MIGINDKVILRKFTHRGHTAKIEQERWYYETSFKKLYNGKIFQYSCRIPKATLASLRYPEEYMQSLWECTLNAVYFAIEKWENMNKPFKPYEADFTEAEALQWLTEALRGDIKVVETRYEEFPVADICLSLAPHDIRVDVRIRHLLTEIITEYFWRLVEGKNADNTLIDNALALAEHLKEHNLLYPLTDLLKPPLRKAQSDERLKNVVNALRVIGDTLDFEFWEDQFRISSPQVKKACFGAMLEISLPRSIPYVPMLEATRNTVKSTRIKIDYYLEEYPQAEQEQILRAIKSIELSVEASKWEALTGYANRKLDLKEAHIGPIAREAV